MEEAVGKLWHRWITRASSRDYPEARVELATIRRAIALWFHAFGGDPGLNIKAATREQWQARRSWLARIAGQEWAVQLAWKNAVDLYLPGAISCFPTTELNRSLYLWLAALTTLDNGCGDWLEDAQQQVLTALNRWPGLRGRYLQLVEAHLADRPQPQSADEQHQEALLMQALRDPGTVTARGFDPKKLAPVPLWLHPCPPEMSVSDTSPPPEITATTDQVAEVQSDHRRQGKKVDHSRSDEGLLAFRLESLFSWAEFVNVDRPQEEDEDLGAKDAANDLDEFAVSRHSGTVKQRLKFDLDLPGSDYEDPILKQGIPLPEWDYRKGQMQVDYCSLQLLAPRHYEPTRLPAHLRYSARKIRAFFETLALNKTWKRQQPQGTEIDWDAYLDALTCLRTGNQEPNTGLYKELRRHHRELSCLLLADLSLSTESAIDDRQTVIDVVRDGLFLMSEALDAAGDRFAIAGFSSKNRQHVRYYPLKHFNEPVTDQVRGRIAAVRPGFYTRMGAAIRYATRELEKERTSHRLLFLFSDGKPNDIDRYEGRYGIEDTRQAIQEVRRKGIIPFCVTIDNRANEYLPYLFGHQHYVVIRNARQLPEKLPQLYARLTQDL
jgi:nitric oxide reductase NorD protein